MNLACEVCVLGAGPAGMVLANILHGHGVDCIVVEKHLSEETAQRGRAGLIDHPSISILKTHGLASQLLENGLPHTRCEFRVFGEQFVLNYSSLADGCVHYIYPQQDLVRGLVETYQRQQGHIRFATEVTSVNSTNGPSVICYDKKTGDHVNIRCDFVAGCDGFHGVSRRSIPDMDVNVFESDLNFSWLAVLAETAPSTEHIIYAVHPNGFAGHMLRNKKVSRYYLQISSHDRLSDWPDERVWSELKLRMCKEDWRLQRGPVIEKQIVRMRNVVIEQLRHQGLFLVGDSAHIITPTGGKGLNLAIQDAQALAETIIAYYTTHDKPLLDQYSINRLPAIWRAQGFSSMFLDMLCRTAGAFEQNRFARKLNLTRLLQIRDNEDYARWFARRYVGA